MVFLIMNFFAEEAVSFRKAFWKGRKKFQRPKLRHVDFKCWQLDLHLCWVKMSSSRRFACLGLASRWRLHQKSRRIRSPRCGCDWIREFLPTSFLTSGLGSIGNLPRSFFRFVDFGWWKYCENDTICSFESLNLVLITHWHWRYRFLDLGFLCRDQLFSISLCVQIQLWSGDHELECENSFMQMYRIETRNQFRERWSVSSYTELTKSKKQNRKHVAFFQYSAFPHSTNILPRKDDGSHCMYHTNIAASTALSGSCIYLMFYWLTDFFLASLH